MNEQTHQALVEFVRQRFQSDEFIPLHEPRFLGNERSYVNETIDSTFVSSVGAFVNRFEDEFAQYVGSKYAVATGTGTAALHMALHVAGVTASCEVITQALTFVATCNAIHYCGAEPVFLDVDRETMGLSPRSLEAFLERQCEVRDDGTCWNRVTGRRVAACVPMHTYGFPAQIDSLAEICGRFGVPLVEDAAESLGSFRGGRHTGRLGLVSAFSFNGNKIITTGGGGMLVTDDEDIARRAKHLTTTAKKPHRWVFEHDEVGFNYRLPNLNAALGVAQLEQLDDFLECKRQLAADYYSWGQTNGVQFFSEPEGTRANYWLNVVLAEDLSHRDALLEYTNRKGVMTRPAWRLMNRLPMFEHAQTDDLTTSNWLMDRIVNIPSSVLLNP